MSIPAPGFRTTLVPGKTNEVEAMRPMDTPAGHLRRVSVWIKRNEASLAMQWLVS